MKFSCLGMLACAWMMVGCESFHAPLSSDGSFDPLKPPGSAVARDSSEYGPQLAPGQFVKANIPYTAFYNKKPKGQEDADRLLSLGTNMKIVSKDSTYVQVELDSGEVGWVPAVMVATATSESPLATGEYQIYPSLSQDGVVEPLPVYDPNGLPPNQAIPTIIDPDAPVTPSSAPIALDAAIDIKPPVEPGATPTALNPTVSAESGGNSPGIQPKTEPKTDLKPEEKIKKTQ